MTTLTTQALLFDLDDTLIRDSRDTRAALVEVCAALDVERAEELAAAVDAKARELWAAPEHGGAFGHDLGISGMEALFSEFSQDHPTVRRFAETGAGFKREVWEQGLAGLGRGLSPEEVDKLTDAFRDARGRHMTTYDEVHDALEELRARYRLGVVTNGPADLQRLKLAATGLGPFFSAVVISGEIGQGKPSPEPFHTVLRSLDIPAGDALMVGDSLPRDVAGAQAAGVPVARIERGERAVEPNGDGAVPDQVITSLSALF